MTPRPRLNKRERVDPETGVTLRRCSHCEEEKPADAEHFPPRGDTKRTGICRPCKAKVKKRYGEEGRLTVQPIEKRRESWKASRERNAEKHRASHRAYLQRVKADPVKHARYLESRRIAHRLKAEREGRRITTTPKARMMPTAKRYLPSAPLVALIERIVDQRAETARILNDPSGVGPEAVCEDLGVSSRTFRRWRDGQMPKVRVGLAEGVLLAAGVEWHEVYSYDDHAAAFLALEVPS